MAVIKNERNELNKLPQLEQIKKGVQLCDCNKQINETIFGLCAFDKE